jgi:hypothetical protein
VNDAPSAFSGQTLKIIAPVAWPVGLPIPIAAVLRSATNQPVWLNGVVKFGGFPQTTLQLRRGWGSVIAPAATTAGTLQVAAMVNGLTHNPSVTLESAPVLTPASGTIAANTAWPANSRIHVTATLTINAGVTLTVGAGTIVEMAPSTEIVVDGTLQVNGVDGSPVVFTPDAGGAYWGGIELPMATSTVNASHAIFTGSGEDLTWFDSHSGYSSHKSQQALFLIAGSGSGTAVGAQLHLNECYCFSLRGQQMNSKTNTWIDLQRTLMQRCVTCGEMNGSKITIDRSALIEFPSETENFVDGDNDAIYLTNGDLSITNSVLGFSKDDGVDSGENGGDNPYTAAADVTPYVSTNNWYEGTYHEGNSLSGTRNVTFTGCVFFNTGQGVEDGYSASATADGPNAVVDGCLFVSNMVGVRWGDNYGSGYSYNGSMEVKNSIMLHSLYKDAFSGNWHPTAANGWIYETTDTNTFGHPYFYLHDSYISEPDPVHHPSLTTWNPATHANLLTPFMPVPGSNVGVAITSYAPAQGDILNYVGIYTVRLSTFSSKTVTVDWAVIGKVDPFDADTTILAGTLTFAPGETLKTINAAFPGPNLYALLSVKLMNPTNAEVTGEAFYFKAPPTPPPLTFFFYGTNGTGAAGSGTPGSQWKEKSDFNTTSLATFIATVGDSWRNEGFDDSTWTTVHTQAGYGNSDENTPIPDLDYDSVASGSQNVPCYLFRSTFTIPDISVIASVMGQIKYDDAFAIYVNGVDINQRSNLPAGTALSSYAGATSSDNATASVTIPLNVLHNGVNTIAVDVRQGNATSSDVTFDLRLTGTYVNTAPFQLNLTSVARQPLLWWFNDAWLLEQSTDLVNWTATPGGLSPFQFVPDIPTRFFRLRK